MEDLQRAALNLVKAGKNEVLSPNSFPNSYSLIPRRRAAHFRPPFLNFTHWLLLLLPIQTLIWLSKRSPKAVNQWKKMASGALHKIRHLRSAPPSSVDCCNYMRKWVIGKVFYAVRCGYKRQSAKQVLRHAFPNRTRTLKQPYLCEVGCNEPHVVKA